MWKWKRRDGERDEVGQGRFDAIEVGTGHM
jgi:hypothetical protein